MSDTNDPNVRWDVVFFEDDDGAISAEPGRLTRVEAWLDDEQLARLRGLLPDSLPHTNDTLVQVAIDLAHERRLWHEAQRAGTGAAS